MLVCSDIHLYQILNLREEEEGGEVKITSENLWPISILSKYSNPKCHYRWIQLVQRPEHFGHMSDRTLNLFPDSQTTKMTKHGSLERQIIL